MTAIPSTLITGTIAYLVACVVCLGLVQAARGVGKLNKDDAGYVFRFSFVVWCFVANHHEFHSVGRVQCNLLGGHDMTTGRRELSIRYNSSSIVSFESCGTHFLFLFACSVRRSVLHF
jgi:hypothetical protein